MDREELRDLLSGGLSLAHIGALVSRDPSTVRYWVRKHGLTAVNRDRNAARGGIERRRLERLVDEGLSTREIAERVDRSLGTVRHWLRVYGMKTKHSRRKRLETGTRGVDSDRVVKECPRHGSTEFWLEGRGIYRCLKCRSEAVSRRRRRVKELLVAEAGGRCELCGYDRSIGALHFHHRDATGKRFGLSDRGLTRSLEAAREEARKCALLCSNCHAEVEAGIVSVA